MQRHEASSDEATLEAARNSLRLGRDVVVDSKNLTTQERTEWITAARAVADVSASVVICGQPPTGGEVRTCRRSLAAVHSCQCDSHSQRNITRPMLGLLDAIEHKFWLVPGEPPATLHSI